MLVLNIFGSGEEWLPIEADPQVVMKSLLTQVEEPATVNSIDR